MFRTLYWGAGAALIVLLLLYSVRIYKLDEPTPDFTEIQQQDVVWDCMGTPPNPDPPEGTFGPWD